jgi:hypothetical protein
MKWAGLCAYRCRECNRRFYVNHYQDQLLQRERRRRDERFTVADAVKTDSPELASPVM